MSFLNWPTEEKLPSRRSQLRRRSVALALLDKFGQAFPEWLYLPLDFRFSPIATEVCFSPEAAEIACVAI